MRFRYSCLAGPLVHQQAAPICSMCGKRIWNPVPEGAWVWDNDERKHVLVVRKGYVLDEHLGTVPRHREPVQFCRTSVCWNGKACAKRAKQKGGA